MGASYNSMLFGLALGSPWAAARRLQRAVYQELPEGGTGVERRGPQGEVRVERHEPKGRPEAGKPDD